MENKRNYNGWENLFDSQFKNEYFLQLKQFLQEEYATKIVYPPKKLILNAFDITSAQNTKVITIGQDPYIKEHQAMGMSFSVPDGIKPPPSLVNIFKEIQADLGKKSIVKNGNLTPWAQQGVLLLNSVLTVAAGASNSHANKGWETFTDSVIDYVNNFDRPIVFMLWGANAIKKRRLLTNPHHLILTATHPSPLSAYNGFFGCKHFSKANEFLSRYTLPIDW